MTDILMPALSPTMEEGTLAKWHVKVGDEVTAGQVIAEIETDKATMEVEAVDEGKIEAIFIEAGTQGVKVNTPIARLAGEGAVPVPQKPMPVVASVANAPQANAPVSAPVDTPTPTPTPMSGSRIATSPLARRLAQLNKLDLSLLKGTGPHGRIIKRDIEMAMSTGAGKSGIKVATAAPASTASEPRKTMSLEQMGILPGSYDLIPLDGMRKVIARRLTDSFRDVPHFPLLVDIELDNLLAARTKINTALESRGVKVSVNDIIIKACANALKAVPEANASFTPEGIAMHHHADVAVAVAIDGGLITPIVRKAETKSMSDIAKEMKDLAARARERKLKPEEFQGGTFSVSNLGMFGIKQFASIINEPQGAILSVGAGEPRPVVRNGQIVVATVMTVTLTCDHRVVDGAVGAKFISYVKSLLEDPIKLLA
jgi:pyruvate dehydrogenase E2 component (dihydrolipoamide acetyltransferase)